jgi:AcrR family transcriptional regulator
VLLLNTLKGIIVIKTLNEFEVKKLSKGRDRIIHSAIALFSTKAYENVAISQICKNAKVSNGLFYKHFNNKEEIFKYLLKETSIRIDTYFQKVIGYSVEERLESFIEINFYLTKKEWPLIKVYREGQYKFVEYEKILRNVYLEALEKVFQREISEYEYLFVMSGIRYINTSFVSRKLENDPAFLAKIILNGFFKKGSLKVEQLKNMNLYLRVLFNSGNLKNQLLIQGEKILGNKGVYETKVSDISNSVGGGVGSFYYYYKNKEEFLKEIGINIQNTLLFFLKDNSTEIENSSPLDKHIFLLYLMLEYYQKASYKYQIIRELEFIEPSLYENFTANLEAFYLSSLSSLNVTEKEKLLISNFLLGIAHYMGIEFFFTKDLQNKEEFLNKISHFIVNGIQIN